MKTKEYIHIVDIKVGPFSAEVELTTTTKHPTNGLFSQIFQKLGSGDFSYRVGKKAETLESDSMSELSRIDQEIASRMDAIEKDES